MKSAVIVFPGSNCDRDIAVALERASGVAPEMIWHRETTLPLLDLIVLPGGFAYGDYLRGGAIAARSPIMRAVAERANQGVPLLGICNGFQVLTESSLLPGVLMRNAGLKYICRDIHVRVASTESVFTQGYAQDQLLRIPIAHNEGNYRAQESMLDRLEGEGLVAFRYAACDGSADGNPNGSARDIAGIFNHSRTVLGLMPHPERAVDPAHGGTDGVAMFEGLVAALAR
ncbi:MAG: Phosphoribosylformylglycinamidine synthase subunit PurQ [Alphaproteobacteria bacterium MarineAlpha10_Bin3]|jgi:phosphoribosylformylglycinamidine synthase|nr:MAG: Phosphoribosylformylglycinamidine synthase subunit PurQ [Alphaproteobacteria bacterium MarineAlpha10_Bin3]PPR72246.1 MAG: Phosphoribosylformylglycinamidine synthase subunit PurQ [Alphaproteobacteria bacterium MarineAlpha4_Bin1]